MLEEIINSKIDSAVLGFFLSMPERSFSVIEIATRLALPPLNTARSLSKLVNTGILKSSAKRGKKYYLINPKYKLLSEIRKQWHRNGDNYKDELFSAIKNLGNLDGAFLSGIFSGQGNLPVDILFVGKVNSDKLADFLKGAEKMMGQEINYSIMPAEEFLERRNTFDKFIKDIFDYPHITVIDNLAKIKK